VDGSKEPGDSAPIGEGPSIWGCHPIRVIRAKRIAMRFEIVREIVQPHETIVVRKRHDWCGKRTTARTADCHNRTVEVVKTAYKDLAVLSRKTDDSGQW